MKDEAKKQLDRILGAYDDKLAEADRALAANRAAKAAFPERFAALKKDMILPALQEIADVLIKSGHEATAREQVESSSTVGGVRSAAVWLRVVPRPYTQRAPDTKTSFIDITFSANQAERKIIVSSTNSILNSTGSIGKRGEYEIDALTPEAVVLHVLQTLEEGFTGR